MARWKLGFIDTRLAMKLPSAADSEHDSERRSLDARTDHHGPLESSLELTTEEIENGCVVPVWPSIRHNPCGAIRSLQFLGMAKAIAQDPRRQFHCLKGFACFDPSHTLLVDEAGNTSHQLFPMAGDLRGRAGEWSWVDWHGRPTPHAVGSNPLARPIVNPAPSIAEIISAAMADGAPAGVDVEKLAALTRRKIFEGIGAVIQLPKPTATQKIITALKQQGIGAFDNDAIAAAAAAKFLEFVEHEEA